MTDQQDMNTKWNVNSLHEHFSVLISNAEDKADLRIKALDDKVDKIDKINDLKHESMNEVREQLKDQAATFVSRESYETRHAFIEKDIKAIQKVIWMMMGVWLVLQGIIVVVLVFVFKK